MSGFPIMVLIWNPWVLSSPHRIIVLLQDTQVPHHGPSPGCLGSSAVTLLLSRSSPGPGFLQSPTPMLSVMPTVLILMLLQDPRGPQPWPFCRMPVVLSHNPSWMSLLPSPSPGSPRSAAVTLLWDVHSPLLECPVSLSTAFLQDTSSPCLWIFSEMPGVSSLGHLVSSFLETTFHALIPQHPRRWGVSPSMSLSWTSREGSHPPSQPAGGQWGRVAGTRDIGVS